MKTAVLFPLLLCSVQAFPALKAMRSRRSVGCHATSTPGGLYRPFVEYAWSKLEKAGILLPSNGLLVPFELATNEAVAKGMPEGTVVKISVDAKQGQNSIQYGRFALLETLLPEEETTVKGIQVLNLVVFGSPPLPVWGVDLVSLPGGKHLLAMDVQPMVSGESMLLPEKWKEWHETYVKDNFEWGGELPEAASKFFSPYVLWTRLSGDDAVETIQTKVFDAFCAHLDLYLECVASCPEPVKENHQAEYLDYRLQNDPARPMLKSLYGEEWTERVLEEVLFNKDRVLK